MTGNKKRRAAVADLKAAFAREHNREIAKAIRPHLQHLPHFQKCTITIIITPRTRYRDRLFVRLQMYAASQQPNAPRSQCLTFPPMFPLYLSPNTSQMFS